MSSPHPPYKIKAFKTQKDFENWMEKNCMKEDGLWLRFYKKGSNKKTITYAEALDVALCFGWIDGQVQKYDEESWLQKFTPRRARSLWSERNTRYVERLIKEGKMRPQGLEEVEKAKSDGRWEKAYGSQSTISVPADFLEKLSKNKKAHTFYESLNKANKFAIAYRLTTAKKEETRVNRMKMILQMMREGQKFH